jgi:hypothetical protein
MSDSLRRYRAIRDALLQLAPTTLTARQARHLITLAALISGIVGSRQTQLPAIASKLPDRAKRESRVKRFQRWLTNASVTSELYFLPFATALIQSLAHCPLVLVIDGSTVGRDCLALVVSLVYQGPCLAHRLARCHGPDGPLCRGDPHPVGPAGPGPRATRRYGDLLGRWRV